MKATVLTCMSIDNNKFYVVRNHITPVQIGRYIRKHNLQPIKTDLQEYIQQFCKKNNTGVVLHHVECRTV